MAIHDNIRPSSPGLFLEAFFAHRYIVVMSMRDKHMEAFYKEFFLARKVAEEIIIASYYMRRTVCQRLDVVVFSLHHLPSMYQHIYGLTISSTLSRFLCDLCVSLTINIFI